MNKVYDMQRDLIEEYKDDFGKHLDENEKVVNKKRKIQKDKSKKDDNIEVL